MNPHLPLRFSEVDELSELVQEFDLDFQQLGRGPLQGAIFQVFGAVAVLGHMRVDRAVDQRGSVPAACRTFVIAGSSEMRMHWRGQAVDGNDLLIFPAAGELHAVSRDDFEVFTLTVPETVLAEELSRMEGPVPNVLDPAIERLQPAPAPLARFRAKLHRIRRGVEVGRIGAHGTLERWIDEDLPRELLELASSATTAPKQLQTNRRDRVLTRVQAYLADHLRDAPRVDQLCHVAGVSERTLQYAFNERYGMTPKAYVQALRLANVRRELRDATRATSIAETAQRWGFWHQGQLAADYRRQFGELPSATARNRV